MRFKYFKILNKEEITMSNTINAELYDKGLQSVPAENCD